MNVLVSIITVAFNSSATIRDTIESVLNQTYGKLEYIIVDGLSKDDTVEIAESYRTVFEQKGITYTIVSEKDHGIYDAMNKGIRLSHGDIIGMINSDDWYELNAVERVVDTYKKTKFDYFYADIRIINGDKEKIKRSKYRKHYVTSRDWNHPTSFVVRKVYDKLQYKNESLYDDFDLLLRVRRSGYKIVVLNEVLANFRFGGVSNIKSVKKAYGRVKQRYKIYRINRFSRFYLLESIFVETIKLLLT